MEPPHYFLHFCFSFPLQYFIILFKIYLYCIKFIDIAIIIRETFTISLAGFIVIIQKDKGIFFTGFT